MTQINQQQGFGLIISKLRKKDKIYPYASGKIETAEELALRQPNSWRLSQGSQEEINENIAFEERFSTEINNAKKRIERKKKEEEERFKKLREQYGMAIKKNLMI